MRRQTQQDAALARKLAETEAGLRDDDDDDVVMEVRPGSSRHKKQKSGSSSAPPAAAATSTAAAERASVTPLARHVDRSKPQLLLRLPDEAHLVSATTYRILQWGATGHRDVLRYCAATLHGMAADEAPSGAGVIDLDQATVVANRDEWDLLPIVVPIVPPREGHVYVTHEANDKINAGSELYNRIFIEVRAGGGIRARSQSSRRARARLRAPGPL